MRHSIKIFTATYFSLLAILYLADRYTAFNMTSLILIIGFCILILFTVLAIMGGILQKNLFGFAIISLTLFMLVTLII